MAYIQIPAFSKTNTLDNDTEFVIVVDGVEYLVTFKTLSDKFGNTPELLQQINAEIEALRAIVDALPTENPAAPIALKIADTPIIDGLYKPTEAGTYPSAGGLEYDPTEGITYFIRTQGVWTKDVTPINFTPTGVVEEGNTQAVSGGEVFDKLSEVFVEEYTDEVIAQDVSVSASAFGASAGLCGWGFPMKARKKITKIAIKIRAVDVNSTQQRLIVRENGVSGAILHDQYFNLLITPTTDIYVFELDDILENANESKLYCEFYSSTPIVIYRVNPAVVFTSDLGYDNPLSTTANDLGQTQVSIGTSYYDIYHEVYYLEQKLTFNSESEQKIIEISNDNLQLPNSVNIATEITNDLFVKYSEDVGEFEIFSDSLGPQGNNYYSIGIPIGVVPNFDKITVPIYHLDTQIRPTDVYCIIRRVNKEGNIVATSDTITFPATGGTGRYDLEFTFNTVINESDKLYLEVHGDGQFGVYRRHPNASSIFTQANGYPPLAGATTQGGTLTDGYWYYDWYFKTNIIEDKIHLTNDGKELFGISNNEFTTLPNENLRYAFAGSSVTWGDGYLQSGYVKNTIEYLQSQVATAILPNQFAIGTILNNRKYFKGQALRLDGVGEEIEFDVTGNEVSIIQSIERSNASASEIDVFIDDTLYDTINNFNPTEIGTETKTFTATGSTSYFDLGRAFTYGHEVTLNSNPLVVTHNINQGVGFTIPSNADCAIIRKIGIRSDGSENVNHFLWMKNAPLNGDEIYVSYNYGEELFYEQTTIGSDSSGVNECPYGDGTVSFDTTNPSSMGSGLDFRQTDERVVKTYRFLDTKTRKVKLRVKGNYNGSSGMPYFIFNFATNRYFHFQNAGIGGWDAWDFDELIANDPTRGWQRVVEFKPDILVYETTPNDDWIVKGHKIYKEQTLTLEQLRNVRTLPLRQIQYNSGADNYTVSKWQGIITAITETSVTFDGTIDTPINKGDIVIIGEYFSRNNEYFERFVDSINGNTIYFKNPLNINDVVFDSLQDFISKGIVVRTFDTYSTKLQTILDNIQESLPSVKIGLLENPMPNCLARELWGYPLVLDKLSKSNQFVESINYLSLREWQYSQQKTTVTVDTYNKVFDDVLGKYYIPFGTNGQNVLSTDILHNDVSIYGAKAVVQNGWAYVVNQTATGTSLNKTIATQTNSGQSRNGKQPRVILFDDTITGSLTVEYSSTLWSADSCHMNSNSSKLYAEFLKDFLIK